MNPVAGAGADQYNMTKCWQRVETCINQSLCDMTESAAKELLELIAAKENNT